MLPKYAPPKNWPAAPRPGAPALPPRDCVRSRIPRPYGHRPWRQSARVRAPLSRCVIARACGVARTQDAYCLQRADIARVLSVALSYVASSLVATPKNQRKPDSASLRSFAEQRYLARCVAPRDLSLLPCCYSFLIQGKNTCENYNLYCS